MYRTKKKINSEHMRSLSLPPLLFSQNLDSYNSRRMYRTKKKINSEHMRSLSKKYINEMNNLYEIKEIKENSNLNNSFMSIISHRGKNVNDSGKHLEFIPLPKYTNSSKSMLKSNSMVSEILTTKFVLQQIYNKEINRELDDYRKSNLFSNTFPLLEVLTTVKSDMKVNDKIRLRHLIRKNNEQKVHEDRLFQILKFNTRKNFRMIEDINNEMKKCIIFI